MALTKNELNKIIDSLPQDVQNAFFSDSVSQSVLDIGKKYGLPIDKIGELGSEITNVMFGLTQTSDFIKNLSERLGVDKEKAKAVAEDVNQKIFQPIKESLRKVHGLPAESSSNIQAGKPAETKAPPIPVASAPVASTSPYVIPPKPIAAPPPPPTVAPKVTTPPASTYVIPMKPAIAPARNASQSDAGGPPPPSSVTTPVIVGGTKLDFAPPPLPGKPIPQIFAKKITPIDALLDKIDSGEPATGVKTMFQDAKTLLTPAVTMPKQEKYNAAPPNLPVAVPQTPALNQATVKSEIENALGGKIKLDDNSIKDPYREPIE